ncbi:hypothetical protein J6590_002630 [Homalodisca vitripennis]|nr:hypothetical protein J6590_002630 [Homalodisca vitripennis]
MANAFKNMEIDLRCLVYYPSIQGGAKSAHEHGQGAELGPPYSKRVLIQVLDTATALI